MYVATLCKIILLCLIHFVLGNLCSVVLFLHCVLQGVRKGGGLKRLPKGTIFAGIFLQKSLAFLGRLLRVDLDLINWVLNVHPSVHKKFLRFQ